MSNFMLKVFLCLLGWIRWAPKFKDFLAPTAIFKDFQGLEFFLFLNLRTFKVQFSVKKGLGIQKFMLTLTVRAF